MVDLPIFINCTHENHCHRGRRNEARHWTDPRLPKKILFWSIGSSRSKPQPPAVYKPRSGNVVSILVHLQYGPCSPGQACKTHVPSYLTILFFFFVAFFETKSESSELLFLPFPIHHLPLLS